jgi:hypothetical protein
METVSKSIGKLFPGRLYMRLINQTKNTVLAEDVALADTPLKRIKGLLGRKDFHRGQALIIKPCNSIHTFFMRFPIDALFVDKNYKIIQALSSLRPFSLTRIYFKADLVIELRSGAIKDSLTGVGDQLSTM